MRETELGKVFTPVITNALEEGYAIDLTELRNSYWRKVQTVLAKGNSRLVLWMEWRSHYGDDAHDEVEVHVSSIDLDPGRCLDGDYFYPDSWAEHDVTRFTVYRIDSGYGRGGWYSTDRADLEEAKAVRRVRREMHRVDPQPELRVTDRTWAAIRRVTGFKRARREDVRLLKTRGENEYVIVDTRRDKYSTVSPRGVWYSR